MGCYQILYFLSGFVTDFGRYGTIQAFFRRFFDPKTGDEFLRLRYPPNVCIFFFAHQNTPRGKCRIEY